MNQANASIVQQLLQLGFKIESMDSPDRIHLKKYGVIHVYLWNNEKKFDIYALLSEGLYEYGDIAALFKYLHLAREKLIQAQFQEILRSERLYPSDRRGKFTRTSGL